MKVYQPDIAVRYKSDQTPVTDADHAAEEIILDSLTKLAPDIPVIAEEQAAAGSIPEIKSVFFLVDPLDGTKEFVKHNDEFTVNIGLVRDREPLFGLIYAPALSLLYFTIERHRAVCCRLSPSEAPTTAFDAIEFEPLTGQPREERPLTAIISRSHPRPGTQAFLDKLSPPRRLQMGSSLKFCALARGDADFYPRFGPTCEWDTAAGHAILATIGGTVVTTDGKPLLYGKREQKFENPAFIAWRRAADAISAGD
jgi:3'(2'), 5'-bisphosphate nucleotidase